MTEQQEGRREEEERGGHRPPKLLLRITRMVEYLHENTRESYDCISSLSLFLEECEVKIRISGYTWGQTEECRDSISNAGLVTIDVPDLQLLVCQYWSRCELRWC